MEYYVNGTADVYGDGTCGRPFQTISEAAAIAKAGDRVIVAPGIYREHVNPKYGGTKDNPVIYCSEIKGKAIISGAEVAAGWEHYKGDVWVTKISNGVFGNYNPYTQVLGGDWYYSETPLHTGEVYFNGRSMYETDSLDAVLEPKIYTPSWESEFSVYKWYTRQEKDTTLIYANFQGNDPTAHMVEINVRRNCFYPNQTGVDYITVSGFVIKQAATTWAPPTAYQEGMVGPHWSKGWIIEDCEISDSKCVGISLGKYLQPNNENKWTLKRLKHGTQTERESICQAQLEGWNKENIGSHIIRRCHIHHCEQAGIVGHLGCAFSTIEDNHIHHINIKQQLTGAEIAGVKLHAAIDLTFRRNHVHRCTRGLWLDWQAQGTRISQNFFHDNMPPSDVQITSSPLAVGEDLFIEVSHGPTLVDHNILLTPQSCRLAAQGVAFVHNLICGSFTSVGTGTDNTGGIEATDSKHDIDVKATTRYTPYHVPHATEIAGFMTILHGDVRFYNNVFVQNHTLDEYEALYPTEKKSNPIVGTEPFDGYPTEEEYMAMFFSGRNWGGSEDRSKYYCKMPIYTGGNVYFNGARPYEKEENYVDDSKHHVYVRVVEKNNEYFLDTDIPSCLPEFETPFISTEVLGEAFHPEQKFENPDGTPIFFSQDYRGERRGIRPTPGPFERAEAWTKAIVKH